MQRTFARLNQRMTNVNSKREEQIKKRIDSCRSHDERWRSKMTEIDKRIRQENRAAEEKVTKYRKQQDEYLQRRHTQASNSHPRRNSTHEREMLLDDHHRYSTQAFQKEHAKDVDGKIPPLSTRIRIPSPKSPKNLLDESIRNHRVKSHRLRQDKQQVIFQRALVRLEAITQRRKKMISLHETERKSIDKSISRRKFQGRSVADINEQGPISAKTRLNLSTQVVSGNLSRRPAAAKRFIDHLATKRERQLKEVLIGLSIVFGTRRHTAEKHPKKQEGTYPTADSTEGH